MLELQWLGRPRAGQAGMKDREEQTLPGSGQRVGGVYLEAYFLALRLCVDAFLARGVEQDLWM